VAISWSLKTYDINSLTDYAKNPRSLTRAQFAHLQTSLHKFGLIDKPIVNLDQANTVIGGHQRLHVMRSEGVKSVECWTPDRLLTEREVEELNIRLNKNTGSWDFDVLANEWELDDLLDWGFQENELLGVDYKNDQLREKDKAIHARDMFHVLVSVPVDMAIDIRELMEQVEQIRGAEVIYGAN